MISEGCKSLQVVKVEVELVLDSHCPGFEVVAVMGYPLLNW